MNKVRTTVMVSTLTAMQYTSQNTEKGETFTMGPTDFAASALNAVCIIMY